ncbi:hypothetical protein FQA47_007579 [Oryzias melastigma]|uniref:Uncharacterized protein n=1 Tax=Oryzias melastigma TaxID=30732 RepID=A0A834F1W1_ORYME|nr:hypothetical protein FQA47_007579 [Oryzias melastigma]
MHLSSSPQISGVFPERRLQVQSKHGGNAVSCSLEFSFCRRGNNSFELKLANSEPTLKRIPFHVYICSLCVSRRRWVLLPVATAAPPAGESVSEDDEGVDEEDLSVEKVRRLLLVVDLHSRHFELHGSRRKTGQLSKEDVRRSRHDQMFRGGWGGAVRAEEKSEGLSFLPGGPEGTGVHMLAVRGSDSGRPVTGSWNGVMNCRLRLTLTRLYMSAQTHSRRSEEKGGEEKVDGGKRDPEISTPRSQTGPSVTNELKPSLN